VHIRFDACGTRSFRYHMEYGMLSTPAAAAVRPLILQYFDSMEEHANGFAFHYPIKRFNKTTMEYMLRPSHLCW